MVSVLSGKLKLFFPSPSGPTFKISSAKIGNNAMTPPNKTEAKSREIVLWAISLDLASVLFGGVIALLPIFAEDILKVGQVACYAMHVELVESESKQS
jgi:hypothetical protein